MQIIGCQLDIQWEDKEANFAAVRQMLGPAGPGSSTLIVLPEMFAVGFSMHVDQIAEDAGGATEQFLTELATERKAHVMAGVVGRQVAGRGRNEAVVFDPIPAGRGSPATRSSTRLVWGANRNITPGETMLKSSPWGPGNWRLWFVTTCDFRRSSVARRSKAQI